MPETRSRTAGTKNPIAEAVKAKKSEKKTKPKEENGTSNVENLEAVVDEQNKIPVKRGAKKSANSTANKKAKNVDNKVDESEVAVEESNTEDEPQKKIAKKQTKPIKKKTDSTEGTSNKRGKTVKAKVDVPEDNGGVDETESNADDNEPPPKKIVKKELATKKKTKDNKDNIDAENTVDEPEPNEAVAEEYNEAVKPPAKKETKTKKTVHKQDDNDEVSKETKTKKTVHKQDDNDEVSKDNSYDEAKTIYEFSAKDIKGNDVCLDKYKGHVCIIVNVASKCGHTKSNYEQFVEIYDKYSEEKGLRILAFPCNQFGKQEPGSSEKICEFVDKRGVKFDIFEKIEVNGKNAHPLWKFLSNNIAGPKGEKIQWNFTKFIINKEGEVVERHDHSLKPLDLVAKLEKYW